MITTREALNGSPADRDLWKWQRQQDMCQMYERAKHVELAAGWRKEYERLTAMLNPPK